MPPAVSPHDAPLRLLHQPVVIVGAVRDGRDGGLAAAWATRVSVDPALVMISVAPERHTHGLLVEGGLFTVSVLHEDQVETARRFGLHSRRELDKWAETPFVLMDGVPAVADASARLLCRVTARFPAGDHDLFLGEVVESVVDRGAPALPMRGRDYAPRD